jgi:hypothetical protein
VPEPVAAALNVTWVPLSTDRTTVLAGILIPVCTENLIRVDDVMESPKLAE